MMKKPKDDFISITEAAEKWNIKERRVRGLCAEGKIFGAVKIKNSWQIPLDAKKPYDNRIKTGKYIKPRRRVATSDKVILIADDSDIDRKILKNIFADGFTLYEAKDGEETLQILQDKIHDISIVLLDLVMPKKTGMEVLAEMNKNPEMKKIPVVMITGEGTVTTDKQAYDYGVADIIYKPFEAVVIKQRIINIIELFKFRNS